MKQLKEFKRRLDGVGCRMIVKHFHEANSTEYELMGYRYVTIAVVVSGAGNIICVGTSKCSKNDQPSRHYGFMKAVGRLISRWNNLRWEWTKDVAIMNRLWYGHVINTQLIAPTDTSSGTNS